MANKRVKQVVRVVGRHMLSGELRTMLISCYYPDEAMIVARERQPDVIWTHYEIPNLKRPASEELYPKRLPPKRF